MRKKILIADDEPIFLNLLGKILSTEFDTILCYNGKEAIEACEQHDDIALAMFDIDMPEVNGLDAAKTIWGKYQIPFIIFSQFDDDQTIQKALDIGAINYIVKPLDTNKILPCVKSAFDQINETDNLRENSVRAIKLAQTLNQSRHVLNNRINEEENFRKNMVNELHNEMGNTMTTLKYEIQKIKLLGKDQTEIEDHCVKAESILTQLYGTIRNIMIRLRPEILDQLCVGSAVRYFATSWEKQFSPINVDITKLDQKISLPPPYDVVLYNVFKESLTNIAKYANAKHVSLEFYKQDDNLHLRIQDDGIGFDTNKTALGLGITGMREKVSSIGGDFTLHSSVKNGVTIKAILPLSLLRA